VCLSFVPIATHEVKQNKTNKTQLSQHQQQQQQQQQKQKLPGHHYYHPT